MTALNAKEDIKQLLDTTSGKSIWAETQEKHQDMKSHKEREPNGLKDSEQASSRWAWMPGDLRVVRNPIAIIEDRS